MHAGSLLEPGFSTLIFMGLKECVAHSLPSRGELGMGRGGWKGCSRRPFLLPDAGSGGAVRVGRVWDDGCGAALPVGGERAAQEAKVQVPVSSLD